MNTILHLSWDYWLQLWPNMFAVPVWTTLIFAWHHRSIKRHISDEHSKTRAKPDSLVARNDS